MSITEMLTAGLGESDRARLQHISDLRVAYDRIEALLDAGSFVAQKAFVPDTRLAAGYGSIDGRLVFVYSQQGEIGLAHAKKIAETIISALRVGAPVIGFHDSNGVKLEEGLGCMEAFSIIFAAQSEASGVIPQISVLSGDCMGTNAFVPAFADFTFSRTKTKYFFASPEIYSGIEPGSGGNISENGLVDFCLDSDEKINAGLKKLLSYLPSNCCDQPPETAPGDDLNREDSSLNEFPVSEEYPFSKKIDVMKIVSSIADFGEFIEAKKDFAKNRRVGFMRIGGRTAGFVASCGVLSADGMKKTVRFLSLCDAYGIPVINITNGAELASDGCRDAELILEGARLLNAYAAASVPKINVIAGTAIGASYLLSGCGQICADVVYAWPDAVLAPMNPDSAKEIFNCKLETSALDAASKGYVHDIILPSATRKRIIAALEMLESKRVSRLTKKHNVFTF